MNALPNSSPILSGVSCATSAAELLMLSIQVEKPASEKKARCSASDCKKKLTMLDFDCRCGQRFCSAHRQAEDHHCAHNWKADANKTLGKQLVSCVNEKLDKL
jgi:predicted nucleic acid binding AN1-type Zn finger protein